jgi:hypothetical protein
VVVAVKVEMSVVASASVNVRLVMQMSARISARMSAQLIVVAPVQAARAGRAGRARRVRAAAHHHPDLPGPLQAASTGRYKRALLPKVAPNATSATKSPACSGHRWHPARISCGFFPHPGTGRGACRCCLSAQGAAAADPERAVDG